MEQFLSNIGGKSDWVGRLGARVLPTNVTIVDDPSAKEFKGTPLIGGYAVDEEGVRAAKVAPIEKGVLRQLLMSRRPGPDSNESNGHGRAAFLSDAKPSMSNLIFSSAEAVPPAEAQEKIVETCKGEKMENCLVVGATDHSAMRLLQQEDVP